MTITSIRKIHITKKMKMVLVFAIATLLSKTLAQPISIPIQPNLPPFTYDEDVDEWVHPNYPSEELREAIHEWCATYSPADKRENCHTIVATNAAVALRETRKQEGALIAAFKQVPAAGLHGLTPKFFETVSSIYNVEFGMFFWFSRSLRQHTRVTHIRYRSNGTPPTLSGTLSQTSNNRGNRIRIHNTLSCTRTCR